MARSRGEEEACSLARRAAARSRATFSCGVSFEFREEPWERSCGDEEDDGFAAVAGREAGWYVNVVEEEAAGRDMACGVLEVKRVKVSEGGRDILGVKIFILYSIG
jgi:hypothetical protein